MLHTESTIHGQDILDSDENTSKAKTGMNLQTMIRSGVLLVLLSGCNYEKNNAVNTTRAANVNQDLSTLQSRVLRLEEEARKTNSTSLADIQELKRRLGTKANKDDVRTEVKDALQAEQNRIDALDWRTEELGQKIDDLEEHLGIMKRVPHAPWIENDEKNGK